MIGGQYELERILGQGGMGTVWSAKDLRLGRSVAIKFLGAAASASAVQRERFAREARMASRIRSPHVIQVFADGTTPNGIPYVVMELLDGENLATHIARGGPCTLPQTEALLEQICRALSAAHAAGLVHRDIKPANIFLTPQLDGDTFVRLLDFGIAKDIGWSPHNLTQSGEVLGTGYYMSPEQLRTPHIVGAATDIWSLGVVVYEMLTGRVPFDATTFPGLVVCVVEGKFPPPSSLRPELPKVIDELVARALQVNPARRFASVHELFSAFTRIVRANTSEAVIKPEVMRALQAQARRDTTDRITRRRRIQEFTTQLFQRDGRSWRVLLGLLVACAVIALGIALWRWAGPEALETAVLPIQEEPEPAPPDPPLEPWHTAPNDAPPARATPEAVAPPPAATRSEALPPLTAAPFPSNGPAVVQPPESAAHPAARPQRHRRKRSAVQAEPVKAAPTAAEPQAAPSVSDENKYGF